MTINFKCVAMRGLLVLSAIGVLFGVASKAAPTGHAQNPNVSLVSLDTEKRLIPNHITSCGCCLCKAAKVSDQTII